FLANFLIYLFFFFSSRRRHTRFSRDWSSDVCSSDLTSCLYLRDSQLVDGSATLTSLKVDSYGNYVYGLTVANQDASHSLTFHLNLADSLTVLTSDTINQSFVMTKAE